MTHQIKVAVSSPPEVLKTLNELIDQYQEIAAKASANSGLEFIDTQTNQPLTLEESIHPEIPNYSELAFYMKVVQDPNNHQTLERYTQKVIQHNKDTSLWMNPEIQMGLSAAFALGYTDQKYIHTFVDVLRTFDLNHEVYEPYFIELILQKWGLSEDTLYLLASRAGSLSGQWGIENYQVPELSSSQKNQFIGYLLKDSLNSKYVESELLIDALGLLDIQVNTEQFESLFERYKPVFDQDHIPVIEHL